MVRRHTIPPRSPQAEGDDEKDKPAGGTPAKEETLEPAQAAARRKTFGREQGGNQQGNQRGKGNPGDR